MLTKQKIIHFALAACILMPASKLAAKKPIFVGGKAGINMSQLQEQDAGMGFSAELAARGEIWLHPYFASGIDIGYSQSRLPIKGGTIKADALQFALLAMPRFTIIKPMGLAVYGLAGPRLSLRLTSLYEDDSSQAIYDFADYYKPLNVQGIFGIGGELKVWRVVAFADIAYVLGFTSAVQPVSSSVVNVQNKSGENQLQFNIGAKYLLHHLK